MKRFHVQVMTLATGLKPGENESKAKYKVQSTKCKIRSTKHEVQSTKHKRFIGSVYGSGDPLKDINKLVKLYEQGVLKLEELVARDYRLVQVNEALSALAAGEGARGIILW